MKWCKTPFFISFFERSGSTFLVDLLDSHPDVLCYHEIFHIDRRGDSIARAPKFATKQAVDAELDRIYSQKYTACGFKFKYPWQYHLYPDTYEYLKSNNETICAIYLYRKNVLKAAISKQNQMYLANMGMNSNLTGENFVHVGQRYFNIDVALGYMKRRQELDDRYRNELSDFKHKYILAYEDLLGDTAGILKDLCSFLEVDTHFEASAKTMKITDDDVQKAISNYDELVKRLTGTPYEKYLFDDAL